MISKTRPLVIRGDSTLLVNEKSLDEDALGKVRLVAQLEEQASPLSTYRITRESVCRALSAGFSLDTLLSFLNDRSEHDIPQNVGVEIREYATRFGKVTLTLEDGCILLQTTENAVAKLLERNYGDTFIRKDKSQEATFHVQPVKIQQIAEFLAKNGYPLQDTAGLARRNWKETDEISSSYNLPYNLVRTLDAEFAWGGQYVDADDTLEEKICAFEEEIRQQINNHGHLLYDDYLKLLKERYVDGDIKSQRENKINRQSHLTALNALRFVASEDFVRETGKSDLLTYVISRFKEYYKAEEISSTEFDKIVLPLVNGLGSKSGVQYIRFVDFLDKYVLPRNALAMMEGVKTTDLGSEGTFVVCKDEIEDAVHTFEKKMRDRITRYKDVLTAQQDKIGKARYFGKASYLDRKGALANISGSSAQKTHQDLLALLEFVETVDYAADYRKNGNGQGLLTFLSKNYKDYEFNGDTILNLARHAGWDYQPSSEVLRNHGLVGLRLENFPAIWKEYHVRSRMILVSDKVTAKALKDLSQAYLHKPRKRVEHD